MDVQEAMAYFGSAYKMCKALGVTRQNYTYWRKINKIPLVHQIKMEQLSNGLLKSEPWKK